MLRAVTPQTQLRELKTPFKAASKLGNNFTEHKTAIHTCSQCSHTHFLQLQLKSTPVLHRVSHRFFPCLSQIVVLEVEVGQDRVDLQRLRDCLGTVVADQAVAAQLQAGQDRVDLQCLRDRLGTVFTDGVLAQQEDGQDPIENA